jgi:hypothetical protein
MYHGIGMSVAEMLNWGAAVEDAGGGGSGGRLLRWVDEDVTAANLGDEFCHWASAVITMEVISGLVG